MKHFLLALLKIYRYGISPWMAPHCRFHPTCSEYAREAIERHGALRGGGMAARRVLRCHPWHPGGLDPVPNPPESGQQTANDSGADGR